MLGIIAAVWAAASRLGRDWLQRYCLRLERSGLEGVPTAALTFAYPTTPDGEAAADEVPEVASVTQYLPLSSFVQMAFLRGVNAYSTSYVLRTFVLTFDVSSAWQAE